MPVYSERAVGCMDLCQFVAIFFEQWMVVKLEEWYPTMDTSDLKKAFVFVVETALEAGVIHEEKSGP